MGVYETMLKLYGALLRKVLVETELADAFIEMDFELKEAMEREELASIFTEKLGATNYDASEGLLELYETSKYNILIGNKWIRISCIPECVSEILSALERVQNIKSFKVIVGIPEQTALKHMLELAKVASYESKVDIDTDHNTINHTTVFDIYNGKGLKIRLKITERISIYNGRSYSITAEGESEGGIDASSVISFLNLVLFKSYS